MTYKTLVQIDIHSIIEQIEESRLELYNLIEINNDFSNQDIIFQSQKLDRLLNTYEEIKNNQLV